MENYLYKCQYCGKEYKPNRRQKQKYCSNSCRTRAFVIRKFKGLNLPTTDNINTIEKKSETMSWAGIGNAAAGTLAVKVLTNIFTKEQNMPATKKDTEEIKNLLSLQPYPIKNHPNRFDGARPFYDPITQSIVYITKPTNNGTKQY